MTRMDVTADLVVVGGGLGGCSAAIAAADAGLRVVLTEETDRVGGQITSQLVAALDEHATVEQFPGSASYAALRAAIRAQYGGAQNPGGGWVSRLCFEPAVGQRILEGWLAERGVSVLTGIRPVSAETCAGHVTAVRFDDDTRAAGRVFADATELGDLLPLTGAPWVIGSEGPLYKESLALPEEDPHAVQSCTWCAVIEYVPGARFEPVPSPPNYARWRDGYRFDIAGWDGTRHSYRMFTDGPDGRPPFWTYRRLATSPDLALLNWVSNDYADASLVHEPLRARRESREQTLGFIHWLQTEAPHDDDLGRGFRSLRLRPDVAGTLDGLAAAPYVRESRRLRTASPVTEHDLTPRPGRARARAFNDSVGVAHYHADLHPRVGVPETQYATTAPFQVPLRALVSDRPNNLVMAAKNLGATQVAGAAYRVHSGEWIIGEAAGVLASVATGRSASPARALDDEAFRRSLQRALVRRGVALSWTIDIDQSDGIFCASQLLVAAGALAGARLERLDVHPDAPVDDRDRQAMHRAALRVSASRVISAPIHSRRDTWRALVHHYADQLGIPHEGKSHP
ncbi:FAD-dependent oxidoreductase [soil metagenome]